MHPFLENYFKLIKRALPSDRQGSFIGLDMGLMSFRAIELVRRQSGFEILRWKIEPFDGVNEKAALSKILSSFEIDKNPRPVLTAVSGRGTLIRYIDMPRMSLADLQKAFAIDADRYLPFPKNTVYIDSFILDPEGKDKKMAVLIVAAKKELIDGRIKILKECGLAADAVTLGPVAVANAFAALPASSFEKNEKMTAVIDIGDAVSNLMIMGGKTPRFNRDIFIGVQEILKRLENLASINATDGRQVLQVPGDKADVVRQAVDTIMANLIAEIRLSFDYFVTEKNIQISQIVLVGEGASIAGVRKFFEDSFEVPLISWDSFEKVSVVTGIDKEEVRRLGSRLVTALGLALNEYD
ncbi:MAG: type IV pilus assembly protein PilM [Candidatus Omnitrophica bacterium]|nr:type IV pilus assembly protein PilM [Candidatus Omnitrophota bacterium]